MSYVFYSGFSLPLSKLGHDVRLEDGLSPVNKLQGPECEQILNIRKIRRKIRRIEITGMQMRETVIQ